MTYTIAVSFKSRAVLSTDVDTIEQARDTATANVQKAMDAFSEDRTVLEGYGYIQAENKAMDLPEEGGRIILADGTEIVVTNNA